MISDVCVATRLSHLRNENLANEGGEAADQYASCKLTRDWSHSSGMNWCSLKDMESQIQFVQSV